jgi:hypothetical protein
MENYVSIKQTNNGYLVTLNEYSSNAIKKGVWVAKSIEDLSEVLTTEIYPVFTKGKTNEAKTR